MARYRSLQIQGYSGIPRIRGEIQAGYRGEIQYNTGGVSPKYSFKIHVKGGLIFFVVKCK